ncbi:hypothetical protein [Delftia tsuruhatensis]|uniref:hypothetical protein n=1 Tax=Delftia tsuruhatensis TaxID=180282 RepID=UPI00289C871A|nr:hypothetical protein [Delftia tsuruhatensis]
MQEFKEKDSNIYDFLNKLLEIINKILLIPILILIILSTVYVASIFIPSDFVITESKKEIRGLIIDIWKGILPIAEKLLKGTLPIAILALIVGLVKWILPSGSFSAEILTRNLTAIISSIILATLCILPLLDKEVPLAISNIALVIIGYYFGKLKI